MRFNCMPPRHYLGPAINWVRKPNVGSRVLFRGDFYGYKWGHLGQLHIIIITLALPPYFSFNASAYCLRQFVNTPRIPTSLNTSLYLGSKHRIRIRKLRATWWQPETLSEKKNFIKFIYYMDIKYLFICCFFFHNEFQTKMNSDNVMNRVLKCSWCKRNRLSSYVFFKKNMLSYFLFL